jgi:hypothetical protein
MRETEYFRWWVTAPGRRRPYLTSFVMDAKTAQEQYPGAKAESPSRIVRQEPETEEERTAAMYLYQSAGHDSVKPPAKNDPYMTEPPRPGPYRFQDAIDEPAQAIEVVEVAGELLAVFPPQDGNRGAGIPVADMQGTFAPTAAS